MAIFHKTLQYHEDTTEKRDISQEDIEFLKKLQLEMNTQDTTGTADPRFWVIKGSERVINNEDPDELCLQVDGSTVTSTTEETVKYLNDNILPDCNIDRGCKIETGYTWDFKLTYTEDGEVQSLLHAPETLFCDSECNDFPIFFLSFSNYSPPTIFSRHSFHPSSYPISYPVAVFEAIWRSGSGINGHQPGLQRASLFILFVRPHA